GGGRRGRGARRSEAAREPVEGRVLVAEADERPLVGAGAVEPVGERNDAAVGELGELLASRRLDEAGHAALLPKRFKYASMNGSKSPSMTFWTSATFSSVRWSFTIV